MTTIAWIDKYMTEAENMIYQGRLEEGLNMVNGLLYAEPGYGNLHNFIGWAYMYHAHDLIKAEAHFNWAVRFAPDFAPPYLHMGNLFIRQAKYAEAIRYFKEGLTKPEALRNALWEGMAQAFELQGSFREAAKAYKEAMNTSVIDYEVERMMNALKRCRKKRLALMFSFW